VSPAPTLHPPRPRTFAALALLAVLIGAAPARADVPEAAEPMAGARLLAPADGAVLRGGGIAEVAWEPGPEMAAAFAAAEEWEAFLSLDGGETWSVRITPHLDIGLRRFSFPVPAAPSHDARLLLRVGDEREETPYELPGRFVIEPVYTAGDLLGPSERVARTGEAALPGGDGVVAWVEGTRSGHALRRVVAENGSPRWRAVHTAVAARQPVGSEPEPSGTTSFQPRDRARAGTVPAIRRAPPRPRPAPPGARQILLLIERLDE
jgi:hypothetical protein